MSSNTDQTDKADTRPTLSTPRLLLRPFQLADEEDVYRICRQKEIAANTRTIPHPYPRALAEHWLKQHPDLWLQGKSAIFAICTRSDSHLVGAVGLEINERDQNAELGYYVDKACWGRGYCTEAAAEVLRFGFEQLALYKIHAHHMTTNPASGRVMDKIGMKQEGLLRGHVRKWGQFYDVLFYGILRTDYQIPGNSDQLD